jgi:hypothetical protein
MLAIATAKDVHVLGVGPIRSGTIRDGADLAGIKIPVPVEGGAEAQPGHGRGARRFSNPPAEPTGSDLKQPERFSDLEGFTP